MKHLFRQFISGIRNYEDYDHLITDTGSENVNEVKIPAIQLFDELGHLFDKELKNSLINQKK